MSMARLSAQYACSCEIVGSSVSPGTHRRLKMSTRSRRLTPSLALRSASSKFWSLAGKSVAPSAPPLKATGLVVGGGAEVGRTGALVAGSTKVMVFESLSMTVTAYCGSVGVVDRLAKLSSVESCPLGFFCWTRRPKRVGSEEFRRTLTRKIVAPCAWTAGEEREGTS